MNSFPDDLLISIFSHLDLREKVKFESVSRRWRRVLLDKCFRKLGTIHLNYLVGNKLSRELRRLPYAIHSLVVQKGRKFEGIVFEFQNTQALISVMQTITSAQAQHLKHLEITRNMWTTRDAETAEISDFNRLCELVSLCANLEVLKIDFSPVLLSNYINMDVDLSELMHLKVLKGNRVHFMNFQAPNLVEFEYQDVRLHYHHGRTDFRQMLLTISSTIEVLNFTSVRCEPGFLVDDVNEDADDAVLQMPKLRQLSLCSNYMAGFIFNLSESTRLDSLVVDDQCSNIINFDLSVHCLNRFDVNIPFNYQQDIVDQFITSAIRHPGCFSLLKELVINVMRNSLLNDLFNIISPLINYSFKTFYFYNVGNTENLMTSNLLVLVDCCPELERIVVPNFVLDKKCLTDIIISRMRIVDIDLYLEFGEIDGGNELNVLSDLYCALNAVDTFTEKRHCDIKVKVNSVSVDTTNESNDWVRNLADNFRVFFTC